MRMAVVGNSNWFAHHYPERWRGDPEVMCLDVFEGDYSWMTVLLNWRPDITLFYRPELYPERYLQSVDGFRVAFLTEPLPALNGNQLEATAESALRLHVYERMVWHAYHRRLYYDRGRADTVNFLHWPIDGFRPLPIDTASFYPPKTGAYRPVDICFTGKATPHRIGKLDWLRQLGVSTPPLKFVWVVHGLDTAREADLYRHSKVVLNVHADGVPAQEPRIYLAAACGCRVLSEPLSNPPAVLRPWIVEEHRPWTYEVLYEHVMTQSAQGWSSADEAERLSLGVRRLLTEEYCRLSGKTGQPVGPSD